MADQIQGVGETGWGRAQPERYGPLGGSRGNGSPELRRGGGRELFQRACRCRAHRAASMLHRGLRSQQPDAEGPRVAAAGRRREQLQCPRRLAGLEGR